VKVEGCEHTGRPKEGHEVGKTFDVTCQDKNKNKEEETRRKMSKMERGKIWNRE